MPQDVIHRLLALNRDFYAKAGADFDATRHGVPAGMTQCLAVARAAAALVVQPLHVLDAGCGNGRLLQALARAFAPEQAIVYWGVEHDPGLLARAQAACATFPRGAAHALLGDVLAPDLGLANMCALGMPARFEIIACFAVLHHIPSAALRAQALRNLAWYLAPGGNLLLSTWQFEHSDRLRSRIAPWESIGIQPSEVEPGDALLPWDQGVHALRYAHNITLEELHTLAAAAGLEIQATFFADGHEGNLNLYAALARQEHDPL